MIQRSRRRVQTFATVSVNRVSKWQRPQDVHLLISDWLKFQTWLSRCFCTRAALVHEFTSIFHFLYLFHRSSFLHFVKNYSASLWWFLFVGIKLSRKRNKLLPDMIQLFLVFPFYRVVSWVKHKNKEIRNCSFSWSLRFLSRLYTPLSSSEVSFTFEIFFFGGGGRPALTSRGRCPKGWWEIGGDWHLQTPQVTDTSWGVFQHFSQWTGTS